MYQRRGLFLHARGEGGIVASRLPSNLFGLRIAEFRYSIRIGVLLRWKENFPPYLSLLSLRFLTLDLEIFAQSTYVTNEDCSTSLLEQIRNSSVKEYDLDHEIEIEYFYKYIRLK